jgi:hypothetical protein
MPADLLLLLAIIAICSDIRSMTTKHFLREADELGLELGRRLKEKELPGASLEEFLPRVVEVAVSVLSGKKSGPAGPELARAKLLARGVLARRRLEAAEGGAISTEEVAENLHLTRQAVDLRRQKGQLVAWRTSEKRWRFPVWQFGPDGRPLGGLSECIVATELDNEWAAMIFFLSPAESLDGLRPLDLLRDLRVSAAVAYSERYDRHGA